MNSLTGVPITWQQFKTWLAKQPDDQPCGFIGELIGLNPSPLSLCVRDITDIDTVHFGSGPAAHVNYWNGFERILIPMPQEMKVFHENLRNKYGGNIRLTIAMVKQVVNY